jgi:hypothetical protein|tara:strand:+ start:621 stop:821 length:201 start_codon:yes stop_codon:yes gene_type:complete
MVLVLKWFRKPTLSQAIALVISLGFLSFVVMAGDALNLIKSAFIVFAIMWTMWHVVSYFVDNDLKS